MIFHKQRGDSDYAQSILGFIPYFALYFKAIGHKRNVNLKGEPSIFLSVFDKDVSLLGVCQEGSLSGEPR